MTHRICRGRHAAPLALCLSILAPRPMAGETAAFVRDAWEREYREVAAQLATGLARGADGRGTTGQGYGDPLDALLHKTRELLENLRNRPDGQDVSVIMLTARSQAQDIARANAAGVDDYIVKPFDLSELLEKIETVVENRKTGARNS